MKTEIKTAIISGNIIKPIAIIKQITIKKP